MSAARASISVVIPTYNGRKLLEKHLDDVVKVLQKSDEIIIVDDASTDDTANWVLSQVARLQKKSIDIKLAQHQENQRFAAAVNTGVEQASHPFVLLLNNDVSPISKNIVEQLLQWFDDAAMFAVGCAEVAQNRPGAKVYGRGTGNFQRGLLMHWYDPNQSSHKTLWTSGGSMMLDRSKFLQIGGMDTLFYPAYEEDRDLSYRAIKHGWKIMFEPKALVLHQHESTNTSVLGKRTMAVASWKNQYLIVWKNITDRWLLLQHLLWLPYHLSVGAKRSGGASVLGFVQALSQYGQAMSARREAGKLWRKSDRQVLKEYGSNRVN